MKTIDKVFLCKRLWQYFMKAGYSVEVYSDIDKIGRRRCNINVRRISKWTGDAFQQLDAMITWESDNSNDSFNTVAKQFVKWYCNECCFGRGTMTNCAKREFILASSLEELDLKLSSRGF